jgi:DNA-binding CsgD family transcriptional regulator
MIATQPLPYAAGLPHAPSAAEVRSLPVSLLAALLDEVDSGLIICDADGAIAYANHTARAELNARNLLEQADSGLRLASGAHAQIGMALRQAASTGRRRLLALANDAHHLTLSLVPLPADGGGSVRVLVLFGRRGLCSDLSIEMLGSLHGLTFTERRVLRGLVDQASPRQIAQTHGVAISTIRSQIASIRAKLGVSNIDGLLLRAAELPPMAQALRRCGSRPVCPAPLALAA